MAKRRALGKGLGALIPDADREDEGGFLMCPIDAISPNPHQPRQRFSEPELEQMAASVKEKGVLTPLLVCRAGEGYQLIAGERRWRAAQRAGLERVPVVVRDATPAESLELALVENLHRQDLNPIEEALAYQRLLEQTGVTQEELARRLGKDRSTVTNQLRLLGLPLDIQQDLMEGRLSMGHARVLAGVKTPVEQALLRDLVVKKGLSVRQLEERVKARSGRKKGAGSPSRPDPYIRSLEDDLKRSLGTKVEIARKGKGGRIVIHFFSDDELDRLLDLLS